MNPATFQEVPVASIREPGNHRIDIEPCQDKKGKHVRSSIDDLADSIRLNGLHQPIEVWMEPGKEGYVLAFGARRLSAFRILGRATIPAFVVPEHRYNEQQLRVVQALENLERKEISPAEQALAMAALIEHEAAQLDDRGMAEAAEAIAARLGRPAAWVRDRLRLARLDPAVQQMVAAGELLLGHAMLIARIGDPVRQKRLAEECQFNKQSGMPGYRLAQLESRIQGELPSLHGVPWLPDQEFAGKPACVTCWHNTDNQKTLFGGSDHPAGRCLNRKCWEHKRHAAQKAQVTAVELLVKGGAISAAAARDACPEWLKPGPVLTRAKSAGEKPAKKAAKPAAQRDGRTQTADQKFGQAEADWEEGVRKAVIERIGKDAQLYVSLLLVNKHPAVRTSRWSKSPFKGLWHILDQAIKAPMELAADLLKLDESPARGLLWEWSGANLTQLAARLEVELPRCPKLSDFKESQPKKVAPPEKKTKRKPAPAAKKKPRRKKKAR
jgi:ParB/RepB/Spo0J family partition protein